MLIRTEGKLVNRVEYYGHQDWLLEDSGQVFAVRMEEPETKRLAPGPPGTRVAVWSSIRRATRLPVLVFRIILYWKRTSISGSSFD